MVRWALGCCMRRFFLRGLLVFACGLVVLALNVGDQRAGELVVTCMRT